MATYIPEQEGGVHECRHHLDLFEAPTAHTEMYHPHLGLAVGADSFFAWRRRLIERGIPVAGPARLGPPGQASLYFNDPFGNHLELGTSGLDSIDLPVGIPDRNHLDYTWNEAAA
jgi:extradiol dioxygenase family protein